MNTPQKFHRHWSFIVCDKRYFYPFVIALFVLGLWAAFHFKDASHFARVGNFIIGGGVWISMRSTLREAYKEGTNLADLSPFIPGTNALNSTFFNNITFAAEDKRLQIHGFVLVILGSLISSYGDLFLKALSPGSFL
ncbi:hypothetical protein [Geothrix edaphica]|uniref:hypothetical protein n=1 Tax=Geothrix edaphica TaxID=2927976 RepID=UPI00255367BF|nr:hypothetical protein [Geothrix edaphica]